MKDRKYTEAFYCLMNTAPVVNIEHINKLLEKIKSPESFFCLNEEQINKLNISEKIKEKINTQEEKNHCREAF